MSKNNDSVIWIVGGVIAAFGAYELFIKPKAPVAAVVPVAASPGTTVTQAQLPAASNPIASLLQTIVTAVNPTPVTQPITYNPGPTATLPPSNYYVDTPVSQVIPYSPGNDNIFIDPTSALYTPADLTAKQAYDSAMYAQYEASLGFAPYNSEV